MSAYYSNLDDEIREGKVSFYNEQGNITHSKTFTKGILNGLAINYTKSGEIDYTKEYKNGTIYNGVYKGATVNRFYKNGIITKDIEHSPPNEYYILKTTIYGNEIDSVYWRTAQGEYLGSGTYKEHRIMDGLDVLNLLDNTVYSYYKNGIKEGLQKAFNSHCELISNRTYKNGIIVLEESLNPFTNKMVSCIFKDNKRFEGQYFEHNPMFKYYDELIFENGKLIHQNLYREDENGKLKLSK